MDSPILPKNNNNSNSNNSSGDIHNNMCSVSNQEGKRLLGCLTK